MPATGSITAKLSPRGQRGMGFALSFLPGSIMRAIAPVFAALIADYLGFYPIFVATIFFFFIGLGVFQFGVKTD
jgi:MFS family permease